MRGLSDHLTPYRGLIVVNVSRGISGATAGQLLAGLGARVIRVDDRAPDGPLLGSRDVPFGWDAEGDLFRHLGRGSESCGLDLESPSGLAALTELVTHADVVIDDERPADERGVRAAVREARNRGASFSHASITPFGLSGPWMDLEGPSLIVFAMSGLMNFVGEPDAEPLQFPAWLVQSHVGLAGFTAIASSIPFDGSPVPSRDLDIAALDVLSNSHPHAISQTSYTGTVSRRQGNRFVDGYPWTVLKCKDGYVGIIVPQTHWDVFCIWMERHDLITDERFADRFARRQHADELDVILNEWAAHFTRDQLYREAQDRHLPFGAIFTVADALESRQLSEREFFEMEGSMRLAGLPFVLDGFRPSLHPAPAVGEHTDAIGAEFSLVLTEGTRQ